MMLRGNKCFIILHSISFSCINISEIGFHVTVNGILDLTKNGFIYQSSYVLKHSISKMQRLNWARKFRK